MIRFLCVMVTACLAWAATGVVYSGDGPDARAVVDKAIKAHGGEENLAKYPALTMKGKGTFYGLGEGIPYTADWAFQGNTQQSFRLEINAGGMKFTLARVLNGDKGWAKQNENATVALPKDELAEDQEKAYAGRLSRLVTLKDKSFQLSVIGEAKVGEKPVIGIKVSKKGHRDVNLYFDKKTGMLLKHETQVKDFMAGGVEYAQTTFYQEYKEFKGMKLATKVLIQKDGERLVEAEMTEVVPLEKLDDAAFKQP